MKIKVLAVGEIQTGKGRSGTDWHRRELQVFTDQIAGNIPVYGEPKELEAYAPGDYMAEVSPRAGDRGRVELVIGKLTPVTRGAAQPAN